MWESWRAIPQEVKDAVLYELSYINDLCSSRLTQWKSDLHKHYELHDGSDVALEVRCPIELVGRWDEWEWLCGHFQDKKYFKKVKANSINRSKKKLLHQFGSRRFPYRLEERRKGGQSFWKLTCSRRCKFSPGMR
ncbi:uncharacterized protein LOC126616140 [Malus sylvestris]|uniref:uncharacterized protein LOC126616140 n=1 Tax=Malus sylvestris TaxID=3752 RepID=UPI0010A9F921|nr:uncharacterized protein LOC103421115 [Malus domestica]XP_050140095.1 uncharacterized protein LOC126616140 [Malus sylvestris]